MRTVTPALANVLADKDKVLNFFILVNLWLPKKTFNLTSLPYNFDYKGVTYLSDGGLAHYDNPAYTSVVNKASYKISLSDQSGELYEHLKAIVTTATMRVQVGFYEAGTGLPTNYRDAILAYEGSIDKSSFVNNFEDKIINLEGASPMAALDQTMLRETSKSTVASINPNDTCFDYIFEGRDSLVRWGKD